MKIFYKLLIWFIVFSLLPFIGFGIFSLKTYVNFVIEEQKKDLKEILTQKYQELEEFFLELKKEAEFIAAFTAKFPFIDQLKNPHISHNSNEAFIEEFLSFFIKEHQFKTGFIVSKKGDILYDINSNALVGKNILKHKNSPLAQNFLQVLKTKEAAFSIFAYDPLIQNECIFVTAPIKKDGEIIGIFSAAIPDELIYQFFQNYNLLKKTGESLVAKKQNDQILFIIPIRHNLSSAFQLYIDFNTDIAIPMQQALDKKSGEGITVDYRGEKVLAAWTYFPLMNWGLVVKIDLKEIYQPVYRLFAHLLIIAACTEFVVLLAVVFISRKLAAPLKRLKKALMKVSQGQLEQEIPVHSKDEIGTLSQGFNEMVKALKKSTTSIDTLNKEIKQKENAEKAKSEFVSVISHELRTPIGPIKEGINMVLEGLAGDTTQEQKKLLQLASQNANRLHSLINQILDYQRLESNKAEYNFEKHQINDIIKETYDMYHISIVQKHLKGVLELDDQLPPVSCDKDKILEVLANLMTNAIKFTTENGSIIIRSFLKDQNIVVEIRDTGIGIYSEDLPKLFESFRQLNMKTQTARKGTGLGLAICKKIITAHKGKIWVESKIKEGSSFYFSLPLNQELTYHEENTDH